MLSKVTCFCTLLTSLLLSPGKKFDKTKEEKFLDRPPKTFSYQGGNMPSKKKGGKYAIEIRGNMASKGKYATEIGKLFGKLKTKLFNCSKLRDFYAIDEI